MLAKGRVSTKKAKIKIATGVIHIYSTFNNTIVTISDVGGNTLTWASAGSTGFKGARKGTPFAAQSAAEESISNAINFGLKTAKILVKGEGPERDLIERYIEAGADRVVVRPTHVETEAEMGKQLDDIAKAVF